MWDPPGPGLEPASPALTGRFPTTVPPGKPSISFCYIKNKLQTLWLETILLHIGDLGLDSFSVLDWTHLCICMGWGLVGLGWPQPGRCPSASHGPSASGGLAWAWSHGGGAGSQKTLGHFHQSKSQGQSRLKGWGKDPSLYKRSFRVTFQRGTDTGK